MFKRIVVQPKLSTRSNRSEGDGVQEAEGGYATDVVLRILWSARPHRGAFLDSADRTDEITNGTYNPWKLWAVAPAAGSACQEPDCQYEIPRWICWTSSVVDPQKIN